MKQFFLFLISDRMAARWFGLAACIGLFNETYTGALTMAALAISAAVLALTE